MLAVAKKVSTPHLTLQARPYPVPGGLRDAEPTITRRAFLWSLALHLLLALTCVFGMWPSNDEVIATPQSLDATIVPLSAFETRVPLGAPQPQQVDRRVEQKVRVPARKQPAAATNPTDKLSPKSSTRQDDKVSSASSVEQKPGDPNSTTSEPARLSYHDMVATRLAQAKRYPERALRRNVNGDGAIRILISSTGEVSHFEVIQSTSSTILDEELKDMVERASPFPPFPPDLRRDTLAVIVPVSFRIAG
jgi:TonB family protein